MEEEKDKTKLEEETRPSEIKLEKEISEEDSGGKKDVNEQKNPESKDAEKKPEQSENKPRKQEKPKKTEAMVNAKDIPISTKHSAAICSFIKRKRISQAISELEEVAKMKKPVPMKGEIPHRKGRIMSGRFPQKAAKEFIILLKSLHANANYNGIEDPVIVEAKANIGARPFGRYGIRRKRTHITLTAKAIGGKK